MSTATPPKTPAGLAARGRRFWRESVKVFDFSDGEQELLLEACRTLDRLDALDVLVGEQGMTTEGSTGQTVLHPAVGEARQQRLVLARLIRQLDLPDEGEQPAPRTGASEQARYAAQQRWRGHRKAGA